jgi:hypothetical protein
LEDRLTKVITLQKRLKFGQLLENGVYVDLPKGHSAAPRGENNPVSFIAQINDSHNTPYNPFMTITVAQSRTRGAAEAEEESRRRECGYNERKEGNLSVDRHWGPR